MVDAGCDLDSGTLHRASEANCLGERRAPSLGVGDAPGGISTRRVEPGRVDAGEIDGTGVGHLSLYG